MLQERSMESAAVFGCAHTTSGRHNLKSEPCLEGAEKARKGG